MRAVLTITSLLLIFVIDNIYGQSINKDERNLLQERLSPAEMKADIDALVSVLDEAHPFLHYFNSRTEWDSLINEVEKSIKDSLTQFEFYRKVAPIIASLHEVHTYIEPVHKLATAHQLQKSILPFELLVIESRVYVDSSYIDDAFLPKGTEILSINGRGIKDIIMGCVS